ncbi:MAG TPA: hypothetical protein VIC57_10815 [Candidatus Dormibacteraeota bacterium]
MLSPPAVTPEQEAAWYLGYGVVLGAVVAVVVWRRPASLIDSPP